jgi:T-complex protein 1 subunit eta
LLLNIELELKSEKENAEVRLDDPAKYQSIVDAEWNIIYSKLAECANSGAQIVLSRCATGSKATVLDLHVPSTAQHYTSCICCAASCH